MAKPKTQSFHGWTLTFGEHHDGKPFVEGTKSGRAMMGERGEIGIDPDILLQRLKPRLLAQDVAASSPDDRSLWEERLRQAEDERDEARALRRVRAEREQARQAREG